jgi:hypothetical protein
MAANRDFLMAVDSSGLGGLRDVDPRAGRDTEWLVRLRRHTIDE